LWLSANEVLVTIEVESETISNHLETLVGIHDVGLWHLLDLATIFQHSELLELLDSGGGSELLSQEERVIFLRQFQTKSWVSNNDCDGNESEEVHDDSGHLVLHMHSVIRIRHFVVKILILVSNTMMIVILHIVEDGHVVMDVASSIQILGKEIESNIVPVRWLDLIGRSVNMLEISW
jgi:hypothetical protein